MSLSDTIYALSTGAGRSAISIVRLSGSKCREILDRLAGGVIEERRYVLRKLFDPQSREVLDEAVVFWLPGPRSFTGEDCIEFHVHSSRAVLSALFASLSAIAGVRQAEAGEFTRRAVLNGKMDLVEAEGLGDLLLAQTAAQKRQALGQMSGWASSVFDSWRERLMLIRADIEAVVDFVDEDGVADVAGARIDAASRELLHDMECAVASSAGAQVLRDGVKVVLAGLPNTGKSSLLNVLARRDAAIVSATPGTTRDAIEVTLDVGGIPVILTDTAGIRAGVADDVEVEGIRRSRQHMGTADLLIWVASPDVVHSEEYGLPVVPDLVVVNKSDIGSGLRRNDSPAPKVLTVSAKTGAGIDELLQALAIMLGERFAHFESAIVVSARQLEACLESIRMLNDSITSDMARLELKAENIRRAADAVGRITGRTEVEEWLGAIFSRFCIGK